MGLSLKSLNDKRYEPRKRLVSGLLGWAPHRFPIKGGISAIDAMIAEVMTPNPLIAEFLDRLKRKA